MPARVHRVEEVVRRSRFVTTLARAPDAEAAAAFVQRIRDEMPDATHHCWAFVAGPPGNTRAMGMSDDGEPHGTAGRPMLTALLHGGVGEVVAVVARWFGGTKLGTGGLARAYAGGVS
ncbi:MAG TPA: YigZ family protein, partial [Longimicrobiales bacterium]|nr:YigZ family protein [Longimicrobiales bacterium]